MSVLKLPDYIDAILFDWDGTLADSVPLVTRATNEVLTAFGFAPVSAASIHDGMRFPTAERMLYHSGDGRSVEFARGDELAHRMAEEFYGAADRLGHDYVALFPGVKEMLEALAALRVPMALVTNNRGSTVRSLARAAGLAKAIPIVVAEEDVARPKPDPEGVWKAVTELEASFSRRIEPRRVLFVGDSRTDAEAASAAGVVGAGVSWADTSIVNGEPGVYDLVCDHPGDLVTAVRDRLVGETP